MKTILITIALLLTSKYSFSQHDSTRSANYCCDSALIKLDALVYQISEINSKTPPYRPPMTSVNIDSFKNLNIEIVNVKAEKNILTIDGWNEADQMVTQKVAIDRYHALNVFMKYPRFTLSNSFTSNVALVTVPYKSRLPVDTFGVVSYGDLKNIGVNFGVFTYKLERYFANGKKATHQLTIGAFIAPCIEDLNLENTRRQVTKSKQLLLSYGASINYSYNDISFYFIMRGWDRGFGDGEKFIYHKQPWYGLGIGLTLKALGL